MEWIKACARTFRFCIYFVLRVFCLRDLLHFYSHFSKSRARAHKKREHTKINNTHTVVLVYVFSIVVCRTLRRVVVVVCRTSLIYTGSPKCIVSLGRTKDMPLRLKSVLLLRPPTSAVRFWGCRNSRVVRRRTTRKTWHRQNPNIIRTSSATGIAIR